MERKENVAKEKDETGIISNPIGTRAGTEGEIGGGSEVSKEY